MQAHDNLPQLLARAMPALESAARQHAADDADTEADLRQEAMLAFVQAVRDRPACDRCPLPHALRRARAHVTRLALPRGPEVALRRVPETASDPVARFDDEEFDARVREHLDRFGRRLRGLKRTVFFDRIAAAEPAGLDNLADRCGVSAALTRRVERAVLEPLRRHLARELADSLPTVLGAV